MGIYASFLSYKCGPDPYAKYDNSANGRN